VKLEALKTFVAVGETKNFSKAGEQLFYSQSTVSRYISELEKAIGGPLLVRTTRSCELTSLGHCVLAHAKNIVNEWEAINRLSLLSHRNDEKSLQIGYTYLEMLPFITEVMMGRRIANLGTELTMRFGNGEEIAKWIWEGYLSCGIMHLPSIGDSDGLQIRIIKEATLCASLSNSHRLANQKSISMEQLSHETEVRLKTEKRFYEVEDEAFRKMSLPPIKSVQVEKAEETQPIMKYNHYVCLRPSIYTPWKDCKMIPISDWTVGYPLVFVTKKNNHSQLTEILYQELREFLSERPAL